VKPAAVLGFLAVATALGALVVGRAVVLPEMAQPELVDANLAKALSAPLHTRLAEVVLAAHLVLAAIAGRWFGARWPTTIALVLVGGSGLHRFIVLPALYTAWSRADLVAGRPVDQLLAADRLQLQELALVAAMVVLHCVLLIAASRRFADAPEATPAIAAASAPAPATA
jgi:predicted secreted protein